MKNEPHPRMTIFKNKYDQVAKEEHIEDKLNAHNEALLNLLRHVTLLSEHTRGNIHDRGHSDHEFMCALFKNRISELLDFREDPFLDMPPLQIGDIIETDAQDILIAEQEQIDNWQISGVKAIWRLTRRGVMKRQYTLLWSRKDLEE